MHTMKHPSSCLRVHVTNLNPAVYSSTLAATHKHGMSVFPGALPAPLNFLPFAFEKGRQ